MRANKSPLMAACVLSLTLLTGCESMPKSMAELPFADKLGVAAPSDPMAALKPPAPRTWPDAAQDVLNQRARGFGLVNAPELNRYLNGLYARLKTQAGVPEWPGSVHILASNAMQAYATAPGNLYVDLAWLTSVQSEDEIVAVLAHEFGHVYLDFHELEGKVAGADSATGLLAIGMTLAKGTAQVTGWSDVDSLMATYQLGRSLATSVYSRSQESAADSFGLHLSLKLGYSYEHGMKAFLERQASWEEAGAERIKAQHASLIQAQREQIKRDTLQKSPPANNALSQSLAQTQGELNAGLGQVFQQLTFDLNDTIDQFKRVHPETVARIDALTQAMNTLKPPPPETDPVLAPLDKARRDKRTAALLANYELAFQALEKPNDPGSLVQARKAASGATASHAVPVFALYTVLNAQPAVAKKLKLDAGQVLESNLNAEPDRAWRLYQERSRRLKHAGQQTAASKVMTQGMAYFQKAEAAWPDAIRFAGETQGWDEAKRMAQVCGQQFRRVATACTQAAATPAERAEVQRTSQEKGNQLAKKLIKTP